MLAGTSEAQVATERAAALQFLQREESSKHGSVSGADAAEHAARLMTLEPRLSLEELARRCGQTQPAARRRHVGHRLLDAAHRRHDVRLDQRSQLRRSHRR